MLTHHEIGEAEVLARDQLRCWSLMERWRKVSDRAVPAQWCVHGEPPTNPTRIMDTCLDAYFGPGTVNRLFSAPSPLLDYLRR